MIHSFIESKLPELDGIFKMYHVKRVYIFGSATTMAFNERSDIDLLIEPGDEPDPVVKGEILWELYYALKRLFQRDVDMITRDSLTNKYLIETLNRTCIPIYG